MFILPSILSAPLVAAGLCPGYALAPAGSPQPLALVIPLQLTDTAPRLQALAPPTPALAPAGVRDTDTPTWPPQQLSSLHKLCQEIHTLSTITYLLWRFLDWETLACVRAPAVLGAVAAGVVTQRVRPHTLVLAALDRVEAALLLSLAPVQLRVQAASLRVLALARPALLVTLVTRLNADSVTVLPVAIMTWFKVTWRTLLSVYNQTNLLMSSNSWHFLFLAWHWSCLHVPLQGSSRGMQSVPQSFIPGLS